MDVIHAILDLAALLLWLNWRSTRFVPASASALSLLSTLKRAEPRPTVRWLSLASLFALLVTRSAFYRQIGAGVNWLPVMDLVAIVVPFRSDEYLLMLAFSFLSFGLLLAIFYSWLILISAANRTASDSDPYQKLIRLLYLGWLDHWPVALKLLLPMMTGTLLWASLSPGFAWLGLIPSPQSAGHLWQQSLLLGVAAWLPWKILLLSLLAIYVVNSYIYLGRFAFLDFVSTTTRNLLRPLAFVPLRAGKIDLAPFVAVAAVVVVSELLERGLPALYRRLPL